MNALAITIFSTLKRLCLPRSERKACSEAAPVGRPAPRVREVPRTDRLTAWCVWICWFLCAVAALWFIIEFSRNVPWYDEYWMTSVLTHQQPVTLSWLWSQNHEHRIPVPRLILLGLAELSDTDFRAGTVFSWLVMTIASAQLLIAARRLRGRYCWTDVFFPLALLHWGNSENLLWGFQVAFSLSTWLMITLLILIIQCRGRLSLGQALAAGACLLLLSLCGAQGMVAVVLLSFWLAYTELRDARLNGWRLLSRIGRLALPCLACVVVVCYFATYKAPPYHPHTNGWKAVRASLEFLAAGLGPATNQEWPYFHWTVALLSAVSLASLAVAWKTRRWDRPSIVGMFLFLTALLALAAALGKGRACFGVGAGGIPRYVWLSAPIYCGIYLAASRYARPTFATLVQGFLVLAVVYLAKENFKGGRTWASEMRNKKEHIEQAAREGMHYGRIALKYGDPWYANARHLEMLRNAGMGPYRGTTKLIPLQPRYPMFATQPLLVNGAFVSEAECAGKTCLLIHNPGIVTFEVPLNAERLEGRFGILRREKPTDGIEIVIECVPPTGPRTVLWRRFLNPARVVPDQGVQSLQVDLPSCPAGSKLELHTTDLPVRDHDAWDWSYWTDLRIQ
jgi:hypothetical protein